MRVCVCVCVCGHDVLFSGLIFATYSLRGRGRFRVPCCARLLNVIVLVLHVGIVDICPSNEAGGGCKEPFLGL